MAAIKEWVRPIYRRLIDALPTALHVRLDYLRFHGALPRLNPPETFNEKIAWRKLYDRNPLMPPLIDKVRAKEIVSARFGADFIIPTLAVYDSVDQLDFALPPLSAPPYLIKTNHGSGYNVFVREKPSDPTALRAALARQLATPYADIMEEWAYSEIKPKILVEPIIESESGDLPDYKFHTFQGKVVAIELVVDRFGSYGINLYDRNWVPLPIRRYAKRPPHTGPVAPPKQLAQMIKMAEALAQPFSYVRVDLYEVDGAIKFGEMTFYPGGGHDQFDPPEWNEIFALQWTQDWSARADGK